MVLLDGGSTLGRAIDARQEINLLMETQYQLIGQTGEMLKQYSPDSPEAKAFMKNAETIAKRAELRKASLEAQEKALLEMDKARKQQEKEALDRKKRALDMGFLFG